MRSAGIILGVWVGWLAGAVGCGPPPPDAENASLRPPSRRVVIVQHDRRWPHNEPATMAAVVPGNAIGVDGGGNTPANTQPATPATTSSDLTRPASVPLTVEHPATQPATPEIPAPVAATPSIAASTDPPAASTSPTGPQTPAPAAIAVAPAAPQTSPPLPATQPIVIEARLSIGEAGVFQLAPATQPIPVQPQPLTVQLAAGSAPIRVHLDNPPEPPTGAQTTTASPTATATPAVAPSPNVVPRAGWGMTLLLLVWVLLAGAAGGAGAHLLVADVVPTNGSAVNGRGAAASSARQRLLTALTVGASVAFLVPVLLGLIAPDLLDRARLHQADLAGVIVASLLAGFASRPLMIWFRRSVFASLHDARAEAELAKSRADAVRGDVARATALMGALVESQVDMDSDAGNGESDNRILQAARNLDNEDAEVLAVLAKGADRFRSEPGLASRAELDLGTVQSALGRLERDGYAGRVSSPRTGERLWYLTRQGRKLAATRYIV